MDNVNDDNIELMGNSLLLATSELYGKILQKFGHGISKKFLKDATEEERESFVNRLKEAQIEKLNLRLAHIMNRLELDHEFLKAYSDIMSPCKTIEELKQDNEIANNHLQSVENERSILQRDTDMAVDKLESVCEAIMEHKLVAPNNQP